MVVYIYALRQGKKVVYVGQCKNVERRVKEHKKTKEFESYEVLETLYVDDFKKVYETEDFYIKKFDPIYNETLNSCGRYLDIKHYFNESEYELERAVFLMKFMKISPVFNNNYKVEDLFKCYRKMKEWGNR